LENSTNKIKILTYNAWGLKIGPFSIAKDYHARIYSLPSEIYRLSPDIIFLQEIWKKSDRKYLINELKKRGYKYSYYKTDYHPRIKNFKWLNNLMLGNGLLIISKTPINYSNSQAFSFSAHTATEEFFTRKGVLFCEIEIPAFGKINCINTHLGSVDYNPKKLHFNKKQRLNQLQQLNEFEKFVLNITKNYPLFIGADLNIDERNYNNLNWFPRGGKEYEALMKKLNLIDSYRVMNPDKIGKTYSDNNHYKIQGPEGRLDYLFHANLGSTLVPESSKLVFTGPIKRKNKTFQLSDHYGILSEYKIKKAH